MIGATNVGRDMGPRLSCRLKTGLTADCTAVDYDEETGNIAWTRPTFGGNLLADDVMDDGREEIRVHRPLDWPYCVDDSGETLVLLLQIIRFLLAVHKIHGGSFPAAPSA